MKGSSPVTAWRAQPCQSAWICRGDRPRAGPMDAILSVLVLTALALVAAAIWQWRRGGASKQVWLMLAAAAVMIGNVLIWTIPYDTGEAPVERAEAISDE